jgi:hypothetical protein
VCFLNESEMEIEEARICSVGELPELSSDISIKRISKETERIGNPQQRN